MNALDNALRVAILLALSALAPARILAQGTSTESATKGSGARSLHADAEVDPTAYVFDGYSLHVGVGTRKLRVDLGCFAMDVPELVHKNRDFSASFAGFGTKVQYFLWQEQEGLFVGADVGMMRMMVAREHTDLATEQRQLSVGGNAGYRFMLPRGFYVTTWLGLSYAFGARDIELAHATFRASPIMIFPAVHVGYRFL